MALRIIALSLLGLAATGCAWTTLDVPSTSSSTAASGARRVELDNLTARTRGANPSALSAEQFTARAAADCQANKPGRVRRLVARYPDVALESLRSADARRSGSGALPAIARAYDALFVVSPASGWSDVLAKLAGGTDGVSAAFDACQRARSLIEQGRPAMGARLVTDQVALPPLLRAEFARLRGVAMLLDSRPAEAAATWRIAIEYAQADRCLRAELEMLSARALRRAGQPAEAARTWVAAAKSATALHDPILWERLADLRPANADWPTETEAAVADLVRPPATQPAEVAFDPAAVWLRIGQFRLERGETTAALLGLARAEAEAGDRSVYLAGHARIGQSRALLLLGQRAPAAAILTTLARSPEPTIACEALGILGACAVEQGRTDEGLALLSQAVRNPQSARWPNYALAQADLGLACLTAGRQDEGLSLLHAAQTDFEQTGREAELIRSLSNELAYWQKHRPTDQTRQADILQRIARLDAE